MVIEKSGPFLRAVHPGPGTFDMMRGDAAGSPLTATGYFTRIEALLAQLEVTDGRGQPVDANAGFHAVTEWLLSLRDAGRRIMLVGNGGSASIAGHTKMDLCNQIHARACTFNDPHLLTSLSNDHGYACVFERGVDLWCEPGDGLIAISSSGQSENILRAVRRGKELGARVVTLTGFRADNQLRQLGDWNFYVASDRYGEVETAHHVLGHCLTDMAAAVDRSRRA